MVTEWGRVGKGGGCQLIYEQDWPSFQYRQARTFNHFDGFSYASRRLIWEHLVIT